MYGNTYHDIIAYVDIDDLYQEEISEFLSINGFDVEAIETSRIICDTYGFNGGIYSFNAICGRHEIYFIHSITFLMEDWVEKLINIGTKEDVIEIVSLMRRAFWNDHIVIDFVNWLDYTTEFCNAYEVI